MFGSIAGFSGSAAGTVLSATTTCGGVFAVSLASSAARSASMFGLLVSLASSGWIILCPVTCCDDVVESFASGSGVGAGAGMTSGAGAGAGTTSSASGLAD